MKEEEKAEHEKLEEQLEETLRQIDNAMYKVQVLQDANESLKTALHKVTQERDDYKERLLTLSDKK